MPTATATATAAATTHSVLEVRRLTGRIGAVVEGVDLRHLPEDDARALRAAVVEHRVVFVRDQRLDDAGLRAVAAGFGPLVTSPLHQLLGTGRTTSVIEDDATRPPAGFDWHTDLSWTAAPPRFGFLQALDIPDYGGDTIWSCLVAALAALPPEVRADLERLAAEHRPDPTLLASIDRHHGSAVALDLRRRYPAVNHPLVREHPETGERSLFVSPLYARRVVGLDRRRGDRLLRGLRELLDDPNHQVRWRWRAGDVAIWDETTTCHRALTDHFPQRRRMRRCVVGP